MVASTRDVFVIIISIVVPIAQSLGYVPDPGLTFVLITQKMRVMIRIRPPPWPIMCVQSSIRSLRNLP